MSLTEINVPFDTFLTILERVCASFGDGRRFRSLMGDLIVLKERLADRSRIAGSSRPAFFFDLGCPFSYLAAERVERTLGDVEWVPTAGAELGGALGAQSGAIRAEAERHAEALRLPLVWPDGFPGEVRRALRAAVHAAGLDAGSAFALAASRLAFCGGFDLEDPEILAEAAAAAGIPLDACIAAAADRSLDASLLATAHGLRRRGVTRLPAIRIVGRFFEGRRGLTEAHAMLRAEAAYGRSLGRPLAPAS
jgi:2-hydroxychromene-2-carboxylate isomerase